MGRSSFGIPILRSRSARSFPLLHLFMPAWRQGAGCIALPPARRHGAVGFDPPSARLSTRHIGNAFGTGNTRELAPTDFVDRYWRADGHRWLPLAVLGA